MNCPDCGASDQIAESYCRLCGEWLGKRGGSVASAVTAHAPATRIRSPGVYRRLSTNRAAAALKLRPRST